MFLKNIYLQYVLTKKYYLLQTNVIHSERLKLTSK